MSRSRTPERSDAVLLRMSSDRKRALRQEAEAAGMTVQDFLEMRVWGRTYGPVKYRSVRGVSTDQQELDIA